MKIKGVLVLSALLSLCLPQPLLAAGSPVKKAPVITDVALQDGGVLVGQVVNTDGRGLAKVPISLRSRNKEIANAATDRNGYFSVRGLRGGAYQLVGAGAHRTYRLWTQGNAPPLSHPGALLVAGGNTVRGQGFGLPGLPSFPMLAANPAFGAAVLAAAVTAPVVVHNSERPSSP